MALRTRGLTDPENLRLRAVIANRTEEAERIAKHRQFKAQGQAKLEELIRDARSGKKVKQGGKERKFGSDPFDFVPQGLTHQDFVFGDGPTRG